MVQINMVDCFQELAKNSDGTQRVKDTDTCHWIPKSAVPTHKNITYVRIVVNIIPEKSEPNRVKITAGGDHLNYFGKT